MLPEQTTNILNIDIVEQPSLTYSLDVEKGTISGKVDGLDAIVQAVKKVLMTERYAYVTYSPKYGAELGALAGQDPAFMNAFLEQRISEALLEDERILSISDFKATQLSVDSMSITFTVNSNMGTVMIDTEVQL